MSNKFYRFFYQFTIYIYYPNIYFLSYCRAIVICFELMFYLVIYNIIFNVIKICNYCIDQKYRNKTYKAYILLLY